MGYCSKCGDITTDGQYLCLPCRIELGEETEDNYGWEDSELLK